MLKPLIESLRTVVSTANDRMHVMHAQGLITIADGMMDIQSHISAAMDHLELASKIAERIDKQIEDNHPDNNDRDAGRVCDQCNHDLEVNADFCCVRCGAQN